MRKTALITVSVCAVLATACAHREEQTRVWNFPPPALERVPPPQPAPPPPEPPVPEEDVPEPPQEHELDGVASWYGPGFHGREAASGETFDQNELTAAHRTLPFGTVVRVTRVDTGQSIEVEITDRGPMPKARVIDLSKAAAQQIGITDEEGVCDVKLEVVKLGEEETAAE